AEAVAALIYDWDRRTAVVLRSPALAKIVGFTPEEADADERWWRDRIHPDDLPAAQARLGRALADNEPGFAVEYRVQHRDGHWVHVWDRCMIVRDCDDQVTRIIGSAVDVTELKRAQHELQKAKEIAESADRAKDQFLAVLSHELRTPLTPVLGAVHIWANDETVPAKAREDLEMIRRNIELEARLIDDLLDLTRVARGKIDLQLQPCDAHLAIQRAVEICRPEMAQKNHALTIDLAATRSVIVADAARFQQIIWNLVQNAVKFTPDHRHIAVTTACEHDQLVVRVSDDGIGIAPESIGRIFDAFEQVSRDVTRRFGGLGLGLTISKKLVDLHGGELQAQSDGIDRGSTFTLRFRLDTVHAPVEPAPPDHDIDGDGEGDGERVTLSDHGHDSLRILLVEDHADTAEVIARLLRANRYQVQTAGNVAEALDLAAREVFDLVISDLGLPDGTGHELMRQLINRANPIKGIALTGFGMEADLDLSRESGFAEHLTKPVDLHRLEASIHRVVSAD
ncbi:MAG: PAS domain-containing protein, partial [Anaerolineae bacterium]|nr:PAS domain-containing protein [Phycisphaerae bacterium]